jgi:hypothetical protein
MVTAMTRNGVRRLVCISALGVGDSQPRRCGSVRGGATEHLVEANTCSLVVKGAESPRLMHDPETVPPMQRVDFSRVQEPTYCRTI